ncbi:MAG: hypothetical protein ACLQIB_16705 [Isosphaeraceae bacterium]
MRPIPATVSGKLEALQGKIRDHVELAQLCMEADGGNVHTPDLWINAGIRRSMQILDGFTAMVRARNISCAGALLRVQIDTALRLFACTLVNPDDFTVAALKGERLDRLTDQTGKRLTDAYLVDKLSKVTPRFAWLRDVYERTSGFIHMSGNHMLVMAEVGQDMAVTFEISLSDDRWPEGEMARAADTFSDATDIVLWLVTTWLDQKSTYLAVRQAAPREWPIHP